MEKTTTILDLIKVMIELATLLFGMGYGALTLYLKKIPTRHFYYSIIT